MFKMLFKKKANKITTLIKERHILSMTISDLKAQSEVDNAEISLLKTKLELQQKHIQMMYDNMLIGGSLRVIRGTNG